MVYPVIGYKVVAHPENIEAHRPLLRHYFLVERSVHLPCLPVLEQMILTAHVPFRWLPSSAFIASTSAYLRTRVDSTIENARLTSIPRKVRHPSAKTATRVQAAPVSSLSAGAESIPHCRNAHCKKRKTLAVLCVEASSIKFHSNCGFWTRLSTGSALQVFSCAISKQKTSQCFSSLGKLGAHRLPDFCCQARVKHPGLPAWQARFIC